MAKLNHSPDTQEEYKAWLGKQVPHNMTCYQCWPVVNINGYIIDFVFPGHDSVPESWSYMFGNYPNAKYYHPTYNEELDIYE